MTESKKLRKRDHVKHHAKKIFRDEDRLLFASFVIILAALIVVAVVYVSGHQNNIVYKSIDSAPSAPTKVLTSQQVAQSGAYSISVSNVTASDKKDPAFGISDSETILFVTVSITNKSDRKQDLAPVTQFYARSRDGSNFPMHPSMYVTDPLPSAKLSPGETIKGEVTFAVPKKSIEPARIYRFGLG